MKQDAVLEQAYLDSLSLKEREEQEAEWDPMEAVMEDERASYIDLIRHFLFLTDETQSSSDEDATGGDAAPSGFQPNSSTQGATSNGQNGPHTTQSKSRRQKKKATKIDEPVIIARTKDWNGKYRPLHTFFQDATLKKYSESTKKDIMSTRAWHNPHTSDHADTHSIFMTFMDREKSKPFQMSWH